MLSKSIATVLVAATIAAPAEIAKSGPQIVTDTVGVMSQLSSFHVDGYYTSGGTRIYTNVSLSPSGGGGTVKYRTTVLQVVTHRHAIFLKGDRHSFYVLSGGNGSFARKAAGKWVRYDSTAKGASYWVETTRSKPFTHNLVPGSLVGDFVRSGEGTWDGRSAIILKASDGLELYVAGTGRPYLLREQGAGLHFSFTDFGKAPIPAVPKVFFSE